MLVYRGPTNKQFFLGFCLHFKLFSLAGTEDFLLQNKAILADCVTVSETECNKDTGEGGKLQSWSRGHLFVVRPCGHIDTWHPLYK